MTLNPSPLGQMALSATLCGPIARHFALRPSLREVAVQVIEQQWRERQIGGPVPSTLTLYRALPTQGWHLYSLADALIGRYCQASNFNLGAGIDVLSTDLNSLTPRAADVDLHAVETLLNECGPFLLEEYKSALTAFWSNGRGQASSPWAWLVKYLHDEFVRAADLELSAGALDPLEAATAKAMAAFPEEAQRAEWANMKDSEVWLLNLDAMIRWGLDPELASALVIERPLPEKQRTVVLVYTLAGRLYRFDSRLALVTTLLRGRRPHVPFFRLSLHRTPWPMFQAQATMLFEQQLLLIDRIAQASLGADSPRAQSLEQDLDEASSLIEICEVNQRQLRELYQSQLPAWLQQSADVDRRAYANGLVRLAGVQRRSAGKSFLYDIPEIIEYARGAVHAAILADHPQASALDLEDVEVVNEQVNAAGAGIGDTLFPVGSIKEVRFSLVQLALENLSVLRAGKVMVHLRAGGTVPDWLTRHYLESLVSRLDLGKVYPDLLRQKLLDDAPARVARQALFIDQVRVQLPLLALEQYLRKSNGFTSRGVKLVKAVFDPVPGAPALARMRPLSFLRRAGAKADVALNTYLIDDRVGGSGPCVLYRPLHRQPLREFTSCQAFFEALCDVGELHDDVLSRLDEKVHPIYARGGFEQPHIVRFLPGSEFSPIEVPAPATLGETALCDNILEHLYISSAKELVARAESQSVSNSENRWLAYEEFGWQMFNTLLPFFNGLVTVSAWMVQMFASHQSAVQQDENECERLAELLFNVAAALFAFRTEPAMSSAPARPLEAGASLLPLPSIDTTSGHAMSSPSGAILDGLDFTWASANQRLSLAQREALTPLKAGWRLAQLGQPFPRGPRQGLYLHAERLWVSVEGSVYEVIINDEGTRVVGAQGQLGPWLRQTSPGIWVFDLGLRLRAGMPLNRRIEQMREANRQRVSALERVLADLSLEHDGALAQLEQDQAQLVLDEHPSAETLQRYIDNMRAHCRRLTQADESFMALNQLKSQVNFSRARASNLFELAGTQVQLVHVLRLQFRDTMKLARALRDGKGSHQGQQGAVDHDALRHGQLMALCRRGKTIIDEVLGHFEAIRDVRRQLGDLFPDGPSLASEIDKQISKSATYRHWQSSDLTMQGVLILEVDQVDSWQLRDSVKSACVGLQMQGTLDGDTSFTQQERIDVLDGSARNFAVALEDARSYQAGGRVEAVKSPIEVYIRTLQTLLQEAETELAQHIRMQSGDEPALPGTGKHTVIKTRNRGSVVGQRRKGSGGKPDTVVVLDPLENTELARYEETTEAGVWQPVVAPEVPPATRASLGNLLKRAGKLLSTAERQMQRARSQARTASIGVEMEEILVQQAGPLEALAQDIEEALTVQNEVDRATSGHDAAIEAKALSDKATAMRELGRELRITIAKVQPPTVSRVAYLKAQGEISIARTKGREPSARRKGFPQDYLQEYVISDKAGQPLWFAHFHYASLETQSSDFTAAHLKTREQRFSGGQYQVKKEQNNQVVIQVYRSQIDLASARALFLNL
ncbi:hypothetical protein N5D52_19575 [Pseudomonas sp. GD03860]|uniref:dermonecrotic toxin domain-containing protein n=1 Tax=Pseudomonas TaxID=286 RepID=UPI002363A98B|nr:MULTISPECIES: DUF6543 domain-containing protein [Pseudomonas]MDD2061212.1 hypothetical protein [Pseudomonas putida]MDH0639141.1 hypothetical protein [Pseudomonas sp. GD03860]